MATEHMVQDPVLIRSASPESHLLKVVLVTLSPDTAEWGQKMLPALGFSLETVRPEEATLLDANDELIFLIDIASLGLQAGEVCRSIRSTHGKPSQLFIGLVPLERLRELDPRWGLDDFLLEPVSPQELSARVRLLRYRRELEAPKNGLRVQDLWMDFDNYEVSVRGEPIYLTFKEYELLKFLATHPGRVFSREALLAQVWGYDFYGGTRTVDVHVRRLREKLGPKYGALIQTVRQVGYKFSREIS